MENKTIEQKEIKFNIVKKEFGKNEDVKVRFVKDKFVEITIQDFSKKRMKFTYLLIEGDNLNKFLNIFK